MDRSHRRGVPHKTNLADSADSARNVNDPLTVRLVCTKIPYQSIYGIARNDAPNGYLLVKQRPSSCGAGCVPAGFLGEAPVL